MIHRDKVKYAGVKNAVRKKKMAKPGRCLMTTADKRRPILKNGISRVHFLLLHTTKMFPRKSHLPLEISHLKSNGISGPVYLG